MGWFDIFTNPNTGMGDPDRDAIAGALPHRPIFLEREVLSSAYHHWAIRRVVDYAPEKSFEKGGTLALGGSSPNGREIIDTVNYLVQSDNRVALPDRPRLNISQYFTYAQTEANRTGGAAIFMDIDDGQPLDQPVNVNRIKEIRSIRVFNRFAIYPVWGDGYLSGRLDPDYYQLYTAYTMTAIDGANIHPSRILPFYGLRMPIDDTGWLDNGWRGDSAIRPILQAAVMFDSTLASVADRLQRFVIPVLQIKNLLDNLRNDRINRSLSANGTTYSDKSYEQRVEQRARALQRGWSVFKVLVSDMDNEEVSTVAINFAGVNENLVSLRDHLVATTGFPEFIMLGKHGTGLGQVEKGERAAVQSIVEGCQTKMRGNLETLLTYYFLSQKSVTRGEIPDSWRWEWTPLWQETREEKAKTYLAEAQAIATLVKASIDNSIQFNDPTPVLRNTEIRTSLFGGNEFGGIGNMQLQEETAIAQLPPSETTAELEPIADARCKKVVKWYDLAIAVEYFPGDERHGRSLVHGYGHIRKHTGEDGEALDCYLEKDFLDRLTAGESPYFPIYRVRQIVPETGEFDEDKFMLGFPSIDAARDGYLSAMPDRFFGGIEKSSIESIARFENDSQYWADAIEYGGEAIEDAFEDLTPDQQEKYREITSAVSANGRYSKESAGYVENSGDNGYRCFNCAFIAKDSPDGGTSLCSAIEGAIDPNGWCQLGLVPPKWAG